MDLKLRGSVYNLSDELVVHILHLCNYREILRFAATCKIYRTIVANTTSLQLHIELEASGLEITPSPRKGGTNYKLALEELRRYHKAWLDLDLDGPFEIPMKGEILKWRVEQGYYAGVSLNPRELSHSRTLEFIPFNGSNSRDTINLDEPLSEFHIDPKQDLLVLANVQDQNNHCAQLKLLSMHDGLPHPLARHPMLTVQVDFEINKAGYETFSLGIMDHLLAFKITDEKTKTYQLMIFDWRSGTLINRIKPRWKRSACDFAFLDKEQFVLIAGLCSYTSEHSFSVIILMVYDIYRQPPLSAHFACGLKCYHDSIDGPNFRFDDSHIVLSYPKLTFEFPDPSKHHRFVAPLSIRAGPNPGHPVRTKSATFTDSRVPTLYLPLTLRDEDGDPEDNIYLRVFVDIERLLQTGTNGDTTKPWPEWGIHSTRCFLDNNRTDSWARFMSRSRFLRIKDGKKLPYDLSLFEFNPQTAKRNNPDCFGTTQSQDIIRTSTPEDKRLALRVCTDLKQAHGIVEIVGEDHPTIITEGFWDPFESRLPYRVVTKPLNLWAEGWAIDGEHIVGINFMVPGENSNTPEKIAVFRLRT